jgi:3-oxoadipate enol-lactonase
MEREMGEGPPVVFLHAYPLDSTLWSAEVARVRRELPARTVLAPDLPGFGANPSVATSMDDFAADVIAAMDREGLGASVLVGLSMGGYVALRLHALHPERVAGLVLADTRAGGDSEEAAARRGEQADRVRREGTGWLPEVQLPGMLGETTRRERPGVVEQVRRRILAAEPEAVARALLAMRDRPDSTDHLREIRVPVLAIVGEEDTLTPPEEARRIAEGVPQGRMVVIPRAGHLSNLENPEVFGAALITFLRSFGER